MNTQPTWGREDDDPTGVRALLAGLPDPGPMPDAIAERITLALAAEQAERATPTAAVRVLRPADLAQERATDTQPVRLTGAVAPSPGATAAPVEAPVDELAARRARKRRVVTWVTGAAAAAALVTGGFLLGGGLEQDADVVAVPHNQTGAGSPAAPLGKVEVVASGHNYTTGSLASDSKALRDGTVTDDSAALESRADAKAAKNDPLALAPCAKGLAKDLLARPERLVVDFATFEGQDAMIVVMQRDGTTTAWAVGAGCSATDPKVLAGPAPVQG